MHQGYFLVAVVLVIGSNVSSSLFSGLLDNETPSPAATTPVVAQQVITASPVLDALKETTTGQREAINAAASPVAENASEQAFTHVLVTSAVNETTNNLLKAKFEASLDAARAQFDIRLREMSAIFTSAGVNATTPSESSESPSCTSKDKKKNKDKGKEKEKGKDKEKEKGKNKENKEKEDEDEEEDKNKEKEKEKGKNKENKEKEDEEEEEDKNKEKETKSKRQEKEEDKDKKKDKETKNKKREKETKDKDASCQHQHNHHHQHHHHNHDDRHHHEKASRIGLIFYSTRPSLNKNDTASNRTLFEHQSFKFAPNTVTPPAASNATTPIDAEQQQLVARLAELEEDMSVLRSLLSSLKEQAKETSRTLKKLNKNNANKSTNNNDKHHDSDEDDK